MTTFLTELLRIDYDEYGGKAVLPKRGGGETNYIMWGDAKDQAQSYVGQKCWVTLESKTSKAGKPYDVIAAFAPETQASPPPPTAGQAAPPPPLRPNGQPPASMREVHSKQYHDYAAQQRQEDIFACGYVLHAIDAGQLDATDERMALEIIRTAIEVWNKRHTKQQYSDAASGDQAPQGHPALNDSIPFAPMKD